MIINKVIRLRLQKVYAVAAGAAVDQWVRQVQGKGSAPGPGCMLKTLKSYNSWLVVVTCFLYYNDL